MKMERNGSQDTIAHHSNAIALRHEIQELESTINQLSLELAAEKAKTARIGVLLERAYKALQQLDATRLAPARSEINPRASIWSNTGKDSPSHRQTVSLFRASSDRSLAYAALQILRNAKRKKSAVGGDISRSDLEGRLLHIAHRYDAGVQAVMIEFARPGEQTSGVNWRIAGIVSGRADRKSAILAVRAAVDESRTWTMFEAS